MAGRPKSTETKKSINHQAKIGEDFTCISCGKSKDLGDYYLSKSPDYASGRMPMCKTCIRKVNCDETEVVKKMLQKNDFPFISDIWESSKNEAKSKGHNVLGVYIKNVPLKVRSEVITWEDSVFDLSSNEESSTLDDELDSYQENSNYFATKADCIRMLGYDPFVHENEEDKVYLYNQLIEFLDEGTLEDGFKIPVVIEIVKSFNQVEKYGAAITQLSKDPQSIQKNQATIKTISEIKNNLLKTNLALAKDNGISVNHNNKKSKGGNTLNGILKKLNEIGLDAAEVNLFDLETADAMKQIADISNRSILDQLLFDENDYAEMLSEQKQMISKLESKLATVEEENRLLKIKIKNLNIE